MNYCNQWNNLEQPGLFTFYLQQQGKRYAKVFHQKSDLCQNKIQSPQKNIKMFKVLPEANQEATKTYSTNQNKLNKRCYEDSHIQQNLTQQKIQLCRQLKRPILQSDSKIFHKNERKKGMKIPINDMAHNFNLGHHTNKSKEIIQVFQKVSSQVSLAPLTARAQQQSRKQTQISAHNLTPPRYRRQRTIHQAQNLTFNAMRKKNSFMEFLLTKKARVKILKPKEAKRQKINEILDRFLNRSKQKVLRSSFKRAETES